MAAYTPKTRPYKHQIEALRKSAGRAGFAYFMEMGTGKSKTLIDDVGRSHAGGAIDSLLVIAPKGVYHNWVNQEIPRHLPDSIDYYIHMWTGSESRQSRAEISAVCTPEEGTLRILVMNIEALGSSKRAQDLAHRFVTSGRCMIAVDESITIKNHEAQRTIEVTALGRLAVMRRILTGAPITKNPLDLWGQMEFLGEGILGFRSFYAFRERFAVLREIKVMVRGRERKPKIPVSFCNLDELERLVSAHSFRVKKDECLDLPPKIYQFRDVEFHPEQEAMYRSMISQAHAECGQWTMTATTPIVRLGRLHHILCGWMVDDDTREVREIPSRRVDAIADLSEETDQSTIVWCGYRPDVQIVCRRLRKMYGDLSVVEYHGGVSSADRVEAVRRFQAGDARFFVGTQATAGRGIELTRAQSTWYYSNTFDLDHRVQSEDRPHRIGQLHPHNYVDLRIPDTLDDRLIGALRAKMDIGAAILNDGVRSWLV